MQTQKLFVLLTFAGLFFGASQVTQAGAIWDSGADFSATNNPTGAWSYGTTTILGGSFNLLPFHDPISVALPLDSWWRDGGPSSGPLVLHNGTTTTFDFGGFAAIDVGQLLAAPGTPDYVVTRWTAPADGVYHVHVLFEGMQYPTPTTTDVHVLKNSVALFNGSINGWAGRSYISTPRFGISPDVSYSGDFLLAAGDTIDFVVGNGGNGQTSDGTGVSAQITAQAVSEPYSLTLAGIGAIGLAIGRSRRRRTAKSPHSVTTRVR